jgi:transcriptional regulator with XRE-family HTH domain
MRTSIPFQTIFGNQVRQLRDQAGLTLEQLSQKSGFSINHLRAIERGKVNLNLGTMLILAMCLDTTLQDLLSDVASKLDHRKSFATRVIPFSHYRKNQQNNCQKVGSAGLARGPHEN